MNKIGRKFSELIKNSKEVRLDRSEKNEIRNYVVNFMNSNPIKTDVISKSVWNVWIFKLAPAMIIIVLLIGTSVSYAAYNALPGDKLYAVKSFNEKVRGLFAISPESSARLEAEFAYRRLEEAEKLIAVNRLSEETRSKLEERFEEHSRNFNKQMIRLESGEKLLTATDLSYEFESGLKIHTKIAEQLISRASDTRPTQNLEKATSASIQIEVSESKGGDGSTLADKIRSKSETIKNQRFNLEAKVINTLPPQVVKESIEMKLDAVRESIEGARKTMEIKNRQLEGVRDELIHRLNVAENIFENSRSKIDQKSYNEAFVLLQRARSITDETGPLIEARNKFGIEIDFGIRK